MVSGGLDVTVLAGLRAALAAGASPAAALAQCGAHGPLAPVARGVALGQPVAEAAAAVDTGDPSADLLVRALGVADQAGAGAVAAVEQTLDSVRDDAAIRRLLRTRTAQARATVRVLTALPFVLWTVLVLLDPSAVRFYMTGAGAVTGVLAVALIAGGRAWSRRIVARAHAAAARADPCGGGTAEAVELVAVAMAGGLPPGPAVATVAGLAPPPTRAALDKAARLLAAGVPPGGAFAGTGLAALGDLLSMVDRWGAPAAPVLRRLAADLRADARAAAEEAAETAESHLVFPTTLLTLPAFMLGVVPPLLWAAFAGTGGVGPLP